MSTRKGPQALRDILTEIEQLPERDMRSELLIEFAEQFVEVPETIAKRPFPDSAKVPACESEAYVFTEALEDGSLRYHFAIENPQGISAKAMAVIIAEGISGQAVAEVSDIEEDIVYDVFGRDISMGKGMGLRSMIGVVKALAAKHQK